MKRGAIAFAAVLLALLLLLRFGPRSGGEVPPPWRVPAGGAPLLIAHAGGIGEFPANTMIAFTGAAALGVDVLEMDLQLTADDVLVTMHDATVDRTTDGSGVVRELTARQVLALDASDGFLRSDGTAPWDGVRVPPGTLEQVLATFAPTPLALVLELKNPGPAGERAAQVLAEALLRHDMERRVIVCAFHESTLRAFRRASGGRVMTSGSADALRVAVPAMRFGLDGLWYDPDPIGALQLPTAAAGLDLAAPGLVERAHAHGLAVQYWTVNEREEMERVIAAGADGIMTDEVSRLRALYAARGLRLPEPVVVEAIGGALP